MFLPDAPRETHETFAARCVHAVLEDTTVHRRRLAGGVDGNGSGGSGGSGAAGGGGGCDGGGGGGGGADGDGGRGRGGGGDGGGGDGGNGDRGGGEIVVEVVPMVMAVMISERSKKARTTETCRGCKLPHDHSQEKRFTSSFAFVDVHISFTNVFECHRRACIRSEYFRNQCVNDIILLIMTEKT